MKKTKLFLFSLFAVCLFAFGVTITTLFNSAPDSLEVVILFFVALFVSLAGGLFLGTRLVSYYRFRSNITWTQAMVTLRSSAVAAGALVLLLILSSLKILNLPSAIAVVIVAALFELALRRRLKST